MQLLIDIEEARIETRTKKGGGSYYQQIAYVHLPNRDGSPSRYPKEISLFPPKNGEVVEPYPVGKYLIDPSSFRVNNGRLELGFLNLSPVKKS